MSALNPESYFDSKKRLEALQKSIAERNPEPPPRSAHLRALTEPVPNPVGQQLGMVELISSLQSGRPLGGSGPSTSKDILSDTLPKGAITPRMASLRERREVAMAMLNRLATRDATKQVARPVGGQGAIPIRKCHAQLRNRVLHALPPAAPTPC